MEGENYSFLVHGAVLNRQILRFFILHHLYVKTIIMDIEKYARSQYNLQMLGDLQKDAQPSPSQCGPDVNFSDAESRSKAHTTPLESSKPANRSSAHVSSATRITSNDTTDTTLANSTSIPLIQPSLQAKAQAAADVGEGLCTEVGNASGSSPRQASPSSRIHGTKSAQSPHVPAFAFAILGSMPYNLISIERMKVLLEGALETAFQNGGFNSRITQFWGASTDRFLFIRFEEADSAHLAFRCIHKIQCCRGPYFKILKKKNVSLALRQPKSSNIMNVQTPLPATVDLIQEEIDVIVHNLRPSTLRNSNDRTVSVHNGARSDNLSTKALDIEGTSVGFTSNVMSPPRTPKKLQSCLLSRKEEIEAHSRIYKSKYSMPQHLEYGLRSYNAVHQHFGNVQFGRGDSQLSSPPGFDMRQRPLTSTAIQTISLEQTRRYHSDSDRKHTTKHESGSCRTSSSGFPGGPGYLNPLRVSSLKPSQYDANSTTLRRHSSEASLGHSSPRPRRASDLCLRRDALSWTSTTVQNDGPGVFDAAEVNHRGSFLGSSTANRTATFFKRSFSTQTHADQNVIISAKKSLNVESPSFTPNSLVNNGASTTISSRAANAAPFTPRNAASGTATPNLQSEDGIPFSLGREFTPNYDTISMNGSTIDNHFDPFNNVGPQQSAATPQYNLYMDESNTMAAGNTSYYPAQTAYAATAQPLQYHLYAPIGLARDDLLPYQRTAHDFFMSEKLREEMQKKSEATLQVMSNSQLPILEHYHSLVPLDTNLHKNVAIFGFPSWVYKAQSSKNGHYYCLRRVEGYRLTNEKAIRAVKDWKRVDNGGVVSVIDAFTTRAWGDSSIIFVHEYHPVSKTLAEHHFTPTNRYGNRNNATTTIPVHVLWGYIVQIASAIRAVHTAGLAIRCMDPSKVILTGKNRIRFSACSIHDVTQFETQRSLPDLQQEDFLHFGKLIMQIVCGNLNPQLQVLEQIGRQFTLELREAITWLVSPSTTQPKTIEDFLARISSHIVTSFDTSLHAEDTINTELNHELENGRLARLVMKLGTINERPEYEGDRNWGETGERYMLKLMRDYIFHQVDATGNPVVDLGHILRCLNKLDAGVDEKITLTSRDEQNVFVVTYKELKKQVAAAFTDLSKPPKQGARNY